MSDGRDLTQELRALSDGLWAEAPDITGAVMRRIETGDGARRARRDVRRPLLAVALALLVAAVAALAVPQARTAILDALGLGSVRIELVDDLPPAAPRSDLSVLGIPATRELVEERFRHPLLDTGSLGDPDELRLGYDDATVTYVWRDDGGIRLLVSQLPGGIAGPAYVKLAGPGVTVDALSVEGRLALWIAGDVHGFGLTRPSGEIDFEELRLSGNALLVEDGDLTLRIEGDLERDRAVAIARSLL